MSNHILLLGGTELARHLGDRLADCGDYEITYSLAGMTRKPNMPTSTSRRSGGFGGSLALQDYLKEQNIKAVIDATHPFARKITSNTAKSCRTLGIPYVNLAEPAWQRQDGDQWIIAQDLEQVVELVPSGSRCFLSIGKKELSKLTPRADCWFLMRSIELPDSEHPLPNGIHIQSMPGETPDQEMELLKNHDIDLVISKNSGAARSYHKIVAARNLGLPVIMIERPALATTDCLYSIEDAAGWLDQNILNN